MRAFVHRGRIRIRLEPEDEVPFGEPTKAEILGTIIGSLREPRPDDTEEELPGLLSCALSIQNFRKLRLQGCKLAGDVHTKRVVEKLRASYDAYLAETEQTRLAKEGVQKVEYQFKLPPFKHQILGFHFLHALRTPALFGDCGTGKTYMIATFGDSLIKMGEDYAFIVVCPINLIQHVWIADIEKFTDLKAHSLREPTVAIIRASDWAEGADKLDPAQRKRALGQARRRRSKRIDERFAADAQVYILNYEQLRLMPIRQRLQKLCRRLTAAGKKICLVIDESTRIKSRTSATYRALKDIRHFCERCIIATGTPGPNGILDLWAQFSILDGGLTLHPSFVDYRKEVAVEKELRGVTWVDREGVKRTATKWFPRPGGAQQVYRTIQQRMIRFRTEDCIDLPPSRFLIRHVELNQEQLAAYGDMEEMLYTELEGHPVTARVAVSRLMKLREITGGFLITDKGQALPLGKDAPKMLELDDLLAQSIGDKLGHEGPPAKALVWAQYQWECQNLVRRYGARYGARGLFGGISTQMKDVAIRRFHQDPGTRLLVCHPGSAGHGLTLTEASYAFYYSLSFDYEEAYQSQRRIARPGQTRPMTFYYLVCPDTIDIDLLDVLAEKKDFSDFITDGEFHRNQFLDRRHKRQGAQLDLTINQEAAHEATASSRQ